MCNTLSLHLAPHHVIPPHFTLHHHVPHQTLTMSDVDSKPHHTPRHTIIPIAHFIHTAPLAAHYSILQYHHARIHTLAHRVAHTLWGHPRVSDAIIHFLASTNQISHEYFCPMAAKEDDFVLNLRHKTKRDT